MRMRNLNAPTPDSVRSLLGRLTLAQLKRLARMSGTPYTTLYNIRAGAVTDPRLSTINSIAPHYRVAARAQA